MLIPPVFEYIFWLGFVEIRAVRMSPLALNQSYAIVGLESGFISGTVRTLF